MESLRADEKEIPDVVDADLIKRLQRIGFTTSINSKGMISLGRNDDSGANKPFGLFTPKEALKTFQNEIRKSEAKDKKEKGDINE